MRATLLLVIVAQAMGYREAFRTPVSTEWVSISGNGNTLLACGQQEKQWTGEVVCDLYKRFPAVPFIKYQKKISTHLEDEKYAYRNKPKLSQDGLLIFALISNEKSWLGSIQTHSKTFQTLDNVSISDEGKFDIENATYITLTNGRIKWGNISTELKNMGQMKEERSNDDIVGESYVAIRGAKGNAYLGLFFYAPNKFHIYNQRSLRYSGDMKFGDFIDDSNVIGYYEDFYLYTADGDWQEMLLPVDLPPPSHHFVVTYNGKYLLYDTPATDPLFPRLHVLRMYKIDDMVTEYENRTVLPELTVYEVGEFSSVDINEDGSVLTYIRRFGRGEDQQRELVVIEHEVGVTEVVNPCYNQQYYSIFLILCYQDNNWTHSFEIVFLILFLLFFLFFIIACIFYRHRLGQLSKTHAEGGPEQPQSANIAIN